MNLSRDSVTSFSPVDPTLYEVEVTAEVDSWTLPVIGFATVITYCGTEEGEGSDSGDPKPQWKLRRGNNTPRWGTCPACSKATLYLPALDRHLHTDGSDNQPCWRRITRGEV